MNDCMIKLIKYENEKKIINNIRQNIIYAAYHGKTGHIAPALSIVEILYVLFFRKILRYDPRKPEWKDRDHLILSKGQGSLALYAVLCMVGFFERSYLVSAQSKKKMIKSRYRATFGRFHGIMEMQELFLHHLQNLAFQRKFPCIKRIETVNSGSRILISPSD